MGSNPLGGCIGYFLKFLFSNFRSHIKDSKWGRKYILMNYTCCNGSPQKIPFQFANGKLPHSRCRGLWALSYSWWVKWTCWPILREGLTNLCTLSSQARKMLSLSCTWEQKKLVLSELFPRKLFLSSTFFFFFFCLNCLMLCRTFVES